MRQFRITVTDGKRTDRFIMEAETIRAAKRTAEIAHLGSGWSVKGVSAVPKGQSINPLKT